MKKTQMNHSEHAASSRETPMLRTEILLFAGAVFVGGLGCAATPACRKGAKGDIVMGARTAGEAVKTGAETGVEGVKTAGKAVGGWVEGGSSEAKEKWNEGKQETKATAHEGAADVDREASVPACRD